MKKIKIVIIAVCIVCLALVRIFTPYLGRPFLIYCEGNGDNKEKFYLSGDVNKISLDSAHDPCIKFIKYCTGLEELSVFGNQDAFNMKDIANPNLKKMYICGDGINWSGLNKCTELKELDISIFSNFTAVEDISELTKLERLNIYNDKELSLRKLNELKNLKELTLVCSSEIDCEDLSELDKLEILNLGTDRSMKFKHKKDLKNADQLNKLKNLKELNICCQNDINCEEFAQLENLEVLSLETEGIITGLDKLDNVTSLTLDGPERKVGKDVCGMDSLKTLNVYGNMFSDEVENELKAKGVWIKY